MTLARDISGAPARGSSQLKIEEWVPPISSLSKPEKKSSKRDTFTNLLGFTFFTLAAVVQTKTGRKLFEPTKIVTPLIKLTELLSNKYSRSLFVSLFVYDMLTDKEGSLVGQDGKFKIDGNLDHWYGLMGAQLLWNSGFGFLTGTMTKAYDVSILTTFATKHMFSVLAGADHYQVDNYNSYFWYHSISTVSSFIINMISYGAKFCRPDLFPHKKLRGINPLGYCFERTLGRVFPKVGIKSIVSYEGKNLGSKYLPIFAKLHPTDLFQHQYGWGGRILLSAFQTFTVIPVNALGGTLVESDAKNFGAQRFFKYLLFGMIGQPFQNRFNNTTAEAQLIGRLFGLVCFDFPIALHINPHLKKRLWSGNFRESLSEISKFENFGPVDSNEEVNQHAEEILEVFTKQMQTWKVLKLPKLLKLEKPTAYHNDALITFQQELDELNKSQVRALKLAYYNRLRVLRESQEIDIQQLRALAVMGTFLHANDNDSFKLGISEGLIPEYFGKISKMEHEGNYCEKYSDDWLESRDGLKWREWIDQLNDGYKDRYLLEAIRSG